MAPTVGLTQLPKTDMGAVLLAVNGTLMRGLELNENLTGLGAIFDREDKTAPVYRVWSVDDRYPAMIRTSSQGGGSVALEIWRLPGAGLAELLDKEPEGLSIGHVLLADHTSVLGVLAEPYVVLGQPEITEFGGWRAYCRLARSVAMPNVVVAAMREHLRTDISGGRDALIFPG